MPTVNIVLSIPEAKINTSLQIGDTVYYTITSTGNGFTVGGDIVEVGTIVSINGSTIQCNIADGSVVPPTSNAFYLFSKDNRVNMSSPVGYYAQATFTNDSTSKAEMFATGCEVSISSK